MKKALTLALLAALLSASAVSCASGTPDAPAAKTCESVPPETSQTAAETVIDPFGYLPAENFNGADFRILIRNQNDGKWVRDMYVGEESGDIVNDAVFRRNGLVEDRCNVNIVCFPSTYSFIQKDAANSILAGDDSYELIVPKARGAFLLANQGLFLDWNKDLEYVELDNPWWDPDARENFSINNKLYVMVGDISYQSLGACNVMLFNKTLFGNYKIDQPYKKVLDGS